MHFVIYMIYRIRLFNSCILHNVGRYMVIHAKIKSVVAFVTCFEWLKKVIKCSYLYQQLTTVFIVLSDYINSYCQ